ncbi:MAG: nucleotide pyrophosphohydrolase, partial [Clostridia bacterium]|nr:nucleotide pyrophosphohydrolase [Clostridia bacterium]
QFELDDVKDELADVLVYCIQMAETLGLDIDELIMRKMDKNEKKYPVEKSRGNSAKYDKL